MSAIGELYDAVRLDDVEAVERLFKSGTVSADAVIELPSGNRKRIFLNACEYGNPRMVKLFIQYKATVNKLKFDCSYSPIQSAMKAHDYGAVLILLYEAGANLSITEQDEVHAQIMYRAVNDENVEKVAELLQSMDANTTIGGFAKRVRCFANACRTGNVEIVQLFIQHGANVKRVERDLYSPLCGAIWKPDNGTVIHLLLNKGADANDAFDGTLPGRSLFSDPKVPMEAYDSNILIILRHGASIDRLSMTDRASIQYLIDSL
jgi:ankyrin repeat protein